MTSSPNPTDPSKTGDHPVQLQPAPFNSVPGRLLPLPHLQHFPVAVRVSFDRERRATSWSILGEEPARLVPDPTCVAERLQAQRAGPPLRSLLHLAMAAAPLELKLAGLIRRPPRLFHLLLLPLFASAMVEFHVREHACERKARARRVLRRARR